MEISSLPLMILLISNIQPGQTQVLTEAPKPVLTVQPEPSQISGGENFTLTCDIQGEGWTYRWQCGDDRWHDSKEKELKITAELTQMCSCYGCRGSDCSQWSNEVTLTVSVLTEAPKPVLSVQPEPSQISGGENFTLTCDIQGEGWTYRWQCGDDREHDSKEKELKITAEVTQMCSCYGCRGSDCSQWSDGVTVTVSEAPKPVLTVQPEPSQIFRGTTVTLTCDIQGEGWTYRWQCGDDRWHDSKKKEIKITAEITQMCSCYGCRGSDCSQWSDGVTVTVSGSEASLPVLSVLKLLSFLLAASPYLLVSIIIGVKCYRAHAQSD